MIHGLIEGREQHEELLDKMSKKLDSKEIGYDNMIIVDIENKVAELERMIEERSQEHDFDRI